eukprot:scaffold34601_cov234-Amphora_coffeaeformis.AAC.3
MWAVVASTWAREVYRCSHQIAQDSWQVSRAAKEDDWILLFQSQDPVESVDCGPSSAAAVWPPLHVRPINLWRRLRGGRADVQPARHHHAMQYTSGTDLSSSTPIAQEVSFIELREAILSLDTIFRKCATSLDNFALKRLVFVTTETRLSVSDEHPGPHHFFVKSLDIETSYYTLHTPTAMIGLTSLSILNSVMSCYGMPLLYLSSFTNDCDMPQEPRTIRPCIHQCVTRICERSCQMRNGQLWGACFPWTSE